MKRNGKQARHDDHNREHEHSMTRRTFQSSLHFCWLTGAETIDRAWHRQGVVASRFLNPFDDVSSSKCTLTNKIHDAAPALAEA